tara:strand:+ start:720 stop:1256 length:537 start_codon:yes stop_codon:yes gene_type:complete
MKYRILVFLIFLGFVSCSKQEARRPITASKTYTLAATAESLKKINKIEEAKIENYIKRDSLHSYTRSPNGFWYRYITKINNEAITPQKDDIVEIQHDFVDLNNQTIYSKEQIGIKEYKVDKEDFILGLQMGIKMMKAGETIKFLIPSYNAFGIIGDENKIGINQSIISTLTLLNIKSK